MENIKYLILIRETNIFDIIDKSESLKDFLLNKKKQVKISIKGDSIDWITSKDYINKFKKLNLKFIDFVINTFDMICCQTDELAKDGLANLSKMYSQEISEQIAKKIFISRMGIPNKSPLDNNILCPYDINHSYCVDNYRNLAENKAFLPLYFIKPHIEFTNKNIKNFNKLKKIIIYTGRIKTDGGNILYIMKDIMKKLGDEYELHIFPGRFVIPNFEVSVLSPKSGSNLQLLRDIVFFDTDNVIIHYPYEEQDKTKYLQYADIAIDFSPNRPNNNICSAGNAKLLEYCYYGLKVVCEKNIGNSKLVENGKNGILLEGIASVDSYVDSIKKLSNETINRNFTINYMRDNHNWDLISKELFEKLSSS